MTSCSYDDIQIIKEIREAKHVVSDLIKNTVDV